MYAIFKDGGHQYRVEQGDQILIQRTGLDAGSALTFSDILFVDGKIGTPHVDGASVDAVVTGDVKGKKIEIIKFKRRKNYRRHTGHRQKYTRVEIKAINS